MVAKNPFGIDVIVPDQEWKITIYYRHLLKFAMVRIASVMRRDFLLRKIPWPKFYQLDMPLHLDKKLLQADQLYLLLCDRGIQGFKQLVLQGKANF